MNRKSQEIYLASSVSDYIRERTDLTLYGKLVLASLRDEFVCKHSHIGEYGCYETAKTRFGRIAVDVCLKNEVTELNDLHRVETIGCCCGHGRTSPYIQVKPEYVQKMHELGYTRIQEDKYGNGKWCFRPKTFLPFNNRPWGGQSDE